MHCSTVGSSLTSTIDWRKKLNKFLHTSHTERFRSFLGSGLWLHILCGYNPLWLRCRTVLASAGAGCKNSESDGEKSRWRQEWGVGDFPSSVKKQSCVEYQCTSSSFFLSAFYFLSLQLQRSPLAPPAMRLSSSSTLLLHFSLTQPRMSPVILFIPFFSPFCRSFPSIEVHTSQVSTRPYTLLPSLRGSVVVTGRVDDRQGQTLLISSSLLYRHTQLVGHSI